MQIGISLSPNKSAFGPLLFPGDLIKGLNSAEEMGYSGVELSLLNSNEIDQQSLIAKLEELGLKVYAIATGQTYLRDGFALYDSEQTKRERAIERMKGHIDFAAKLGAMVIIGGIRGRVFPATSDGFARQVAEGNEALGACVKHGESRGVTLLLEPINRYETNIINTLEEGAKLIKEIGSDHLKLLPDTFHMNIEERSFDESIFRAGSLVGYMHFADSNRMAPGWGHIDFFRILSSLKKIDYDGPIGIEILPEPDDFKAAEQALRFLSSIAKRIGS